MSAQACESDEEWQPFWASFCRATRRVPWEPWGPDLYLEFVAWMRNRWREWRRANGKGPTDPLSDAEKGTFEAWLGEWTPKT